MELDSILRLAGLKPTATVITRDEQPVTETRKSFKKFLNESFRNSDIPLTDNLATNDPHQWDKHIEQQNQIHNSWGLDDNDVSDAAEASEYFGDDELEAELAAMRAQRNVSESSLPALPADVVKMPDSNTHVHRLAIPSSSGDRQYTVAYRVFKDGSGGRWECSCRGWIFNRRCKHLTSMKPVLDRLPLPSSSDAVSRSILPNSGEVRRGPGRPRKNPEALPAPRSASVVPAEQVKKPANAVKLPDGPRHIHRHAIPSSGGDRQYIVAYNVNQGRWECSCRGWISHRRCKHLTSMTPYLLQVEPGRINSESINVNNMRSIMEAIQD
jgi:hypothetical protein